MILLSPGPPVIIQTVRWFVGWDVLEPLPPHAATLVRTAETDARTAMVFQRFMPVPLS
jgi:hypothetical protein